MLFSSPLVEALRARPGVLVLVASLLLAVLWIGAPWLAFSSPPPVLTERLLAARALDIGSPASGILTPILTDQAFALAGNRPIGVYVAAQLCLMTAWWALWRAGAEVLGGPHAALAVLATQTVALIVWPAPVLGAATLSLPLASLMLLGWWRASAQGRKGYWLVLAVLFALLILVSPANAALAVALVLAAFVAREGRAVLRTAEPWGMLIVSLAALTPVGLMVTDGASMTEIATRLGWSLDPAAMLTRLLPVSLLVLAVVVSHAGPLVLALTSSSIGLPARIEAPEFHREPMPGGQRRVVVAFALLPLLLVLTFGLVLSPLPRWWDIGQFLLPMTLALMLLGADDLPIFRQRRVTRLWLWLVLLPPLALVAGVQVSAFFDGAPGDVDFPAARAAVRLGDIYQRRVGTPVRLVIGARKVAAPTALLLSDTTRWRPGATPDTHHEPLAFAEDVRRGALVMWEITGSDTAPPKDLAAVLPPLVVETAIEVPRTLLESGPKVRLGFAIIKPLPANP